MPQFNRWLVLGDAAEEAGAELAARAREDERRAAEHQHEASRALKTAQEDSQRASYLAHDKEFLASRVRELEDRVAQGEARLMVAPPDALGAWNLFHAAIAVAVRGESMRLERESRSALRRAEGLFYTSFGRQRGSVDPSPAKRLALARQSFMSVADALAACVAHDGCRAVGLPLLGKPGGRFMAALYASTEVKDDGHLKPTMRQARRDTRKQPKHLRPT